MSARFAAEKELQRLLEQGYTCFPTERGKLLAPPETTFSKDTVTLDFERYLLRSAITMDGVNKTPGL